MISLAISYLKILCLTTLLLSCAQLQSQECSSNYPFQDGEEIVYIVYYNWGFVWVPAGEVKFVVSDRDSCLYFDVIGRSFSSYDSVFKVRDYYASEVDRETILPTMFKRDVHEGKYIRFDSISFDQGTGSVKEYFGRSREKALQFDYELDKVVYDLVSAIYHVRTLPIDTLNKKDTIAVSFFFDKELFDLNIRFLGKKKKKIKNIGKVQTYHLQPELVGNEVFSEGDLMDIWVSADENRVPLLIESPITVGSVKAILRSTKGLKEEKQYLEEGF